MEIIAKIFEVWAYVGKAIAILLGAGLFLSPLIKRKYFPDWFFILSIVLGITFMMPAINFLWKIFTICWLAAH